MFATRFLLQKPMFVVAVIIGALVFSGVAVAHENHASGYTALGIFDDEARAAMPVWVGVWLQIMAVSFVSGVLFIFSQPIARWVVGGVLLGLLATRFGLNAFGLERVSGLIGLLHLVFWSPGLYMLLRYKPFLGALSLFSVWSGWITFVILFSFFFDARDAAVYLLHLLP